MISKDPRLPVKKFNKPLQLAGAFNTDEGTTVFSSRSVILTITIYLPGSNIPVRVRGVEFFVVDQAMDEILLGRPFLHSIGFNLEHHLVRVRNDIHDKHVEDLDPEQFKLSAAKYQGLPYINAEDDPIELPECLVAGIGQDTKSSIDSAFAKVIAEAEKNGISVKGSSEIAQMLDEFRDVFRIKLEVDPPVDVPPLVITPQADAKPYRYPQCRYAPQQRDFITQTIRVWYKNPTKGNYNADPDRRPYREVDRRSYSVAVSTEVQPYQLGRARRVQLLTVPRRVGLVTYLG